MGCCSSTERSSRVTTQQPEITASASSSTGPLGLNGGYNGTRANNIYSPGSSRAPLTAPEPGSTVSSPRQSTTHGRRSSATQRSNADASLSSHYNLPLVAPKSWKSTNRAWTPTSAAKERQDFFDTRVTGRREVWEALRQVSECIMEDDLSTAQGILTAAGITLPTGRVEEGCYDERGELYRIPHIVVKDPDNLKRDGEIDQVTKDGKALQSEGSMPEKAVAATALSSTDDTENLDKGKDVIDADAVTIKCRLSHLGTDTSVLLGKDRPVGQIFSPLRQQVKKEGYSRIRLFYLGKELNEKDKLTLEDLGWREGHVLNVFVIGNPS